MKTNINEKGFLHGAALLGFVVLFAIIGVGLLVASHADTVTTSTNLYSCAATSSAQKVSPPPMPAPPATSAVKSAAISSQTYAAVCPSGQVPVPNALSGGQKAPVLGSSTAGNRSAAATTTTNSQYLYGKWYSWSQGQQYVAGQGATGMTIYQSIHRPYVSYYVSPYNHSLGQFWALDYSDPRGFSDVEAGWSESLGQFHDTNPHLFIFHFDEGVPMGYAPYGGWVQISPSIYPNMPLTPTNNVKSFGTLLYMNNWWVEYDGYWIGYYPASSFPRHFPTSLTKLEAGGEVETQEQNTCTDMGNAYAGTSSLAALMTYIYYTTPSGNKIANMYPFNSDPSHYTTGNFSPTYQFRYGGGGSC